MGQGKGSRGPPRKKKHTPKQRGRLREHRILARLPNKRTKRRQARGGEKHLTCRATRPNVFSPENPHKIEKIPTKHRSYKKFSKHSREILPVSMRYELKTEQKLFRKPVQMNFFFWGGCFGMDCLFQRM